MRRWLNGGSTVSSSVAILKRVRGVVSHGAERWPYRFADVGLVTWAARHTLFNFSDLRLAVFTQCECNPMLKVVKPDGSRGQPFTGAEHMPSSSGFGGPMQETVSGMFQYAQQDSTNRLPALSS